MADRFFLVCLDGKTAMRGGTASVVLLLIYNEDLTHDCWKVLQGKEVAAVEISCPGEMDVRTEGHPENNLPAALTVAEVKP